jgi:LmbE family N-acetylglucosaminyl deacetylase
VGTIVSFHAHPDDESIGSAGTLARAAAAGHRVVLVFATRGELGEPVPGVLEPGEQLPVRRSAECYASAAAIGAKRVEFLGYTDSGMMGEPANAAPYCFWQADVEHAARRLALILDEEEPDILTTYDDNGGYGHPDHIQVHRVGLRAAELAGTPRFFEATHNRDHLREMMQAAVATGEIPAEDVPDVTEMDSFGRPASAITTTVDVRDHLKAKRESMAVHASQISDSHFFLAMPDEAFEKSFGQEWFIRHGVPEGHLDDDLFTGLD